MLRTITLVVVIRLLKNKKFIFILALLFCISIPIVWYLKKVPEFNLEALRIELDDESYEKLSELRDIAKENRHLERSEDDYVPTTITYRGQTLNGKLRLKGDWMDHLARNKWSFRIKLDDPMQMV